MPAHLKYFPRILSRVIKKKINILPFWPFEERVVTNIIVTTENRYLLDFREQL
jgi:type IV secretory pathway VirB9-like protein